MNCVCVLVYILVIKKSHKKNFDDEKKLIKKIVCKKIT